MGTFSIPVKLEMQRTRLNSTAPNNKRRLGYDHE